MAREGKLAAIVGSENVISGSRQLEAYSRDMSFVPRVRPRCIVKPGNADEVQAVVKWANETLTPLVPVSSGPPHFHGDTVPSKGGAVILDLSRMQKIITINTRDWVGMVEPGVTFGQLLPELEKAGFCAYMPLMPRSSKSVVASMLEREPTTMPNQHWDSLDPMSTPEIIWGTGDKLRSGEAAGPDTTEEAMAKGKTFISPFAITQFAENRLVSGAQGAIGVITWSTFKIRPLSKCNQTLLTPSDTLEPLVELSYKILRYRTGEYIFIVNGLNLATMLARTPKEIQALRAILPKWILVVSFEGYDPLPEEEVAYQVTDFREFAQPLSLDPKDQLPGVSSEEIRALLPRVSDEPYWKLRLTGAFDEIFFLTTLDKTPQFADTMFKLAESQGFPTENIGVYLQPKVQGTSCHAEFDLYYPSTETEKAKWLVNEGSRDLAKMGGFFSRPYGKWANFAYGVRSADMQKKVKGIFDPNNILNPGKLGL